MPASVTIAERRWYRVAERLAAFAALLALVYFFAVSRGWIIGDRVVPHSLFGLGASTCLLLSMVLRRRSSAAAIIVQLAAVALFVLSIAALGRGQ